jgi:prolyl oligopeptidase
MRSILLGVGFLLLVSGCSDRPQRSDRTDGPTTIKYPETRRIDTTDTYHGVKVADPYRWLEADVRESPEVARWVEKQNEVARAYLDAIPQRPQIERRLTELWNYARYSAPVEEGGQYFYLKNDGLQNQAVLYVADTYNGEGRVLLDPNTWSNDGTIALADFAPSPDGKLLAYARSEAGSDWQQILLVDVETGDARPDHLQWARFSDIAWARSGNGFYYSRYPVPPEGEQHQIAALNQMLYFHALGTTQDEDQLIYRRPDHPEWSFGIMPSDDGKYLVLSISRGTDPQNQVLVRETTATSDAPFTELIGDFENQFSFLGNEGTKLFFITDLDAPRKRVVTMDAKQPGRDHVTQIVPKSEATLDGATILSGRLIGQYMVDVLSEVEVFDLAGKPLGKVALPGQGTVVGFAGDQSDKETFFLYTSYDTPTEVYRYDVLRNESKLIRKPDVKFDPNEYAVEQVFYPSQDGTRVPMMLAYRKNVDRAQPQPTLLYAYGGFSVPILPAFRPEYVAWMEMGGVLAVANLRGGGEYGEQWHLAGKILNKQNVFDDFIAAAEWLVAEHRTSRQQLAIMGGSNGGLLVGAVEVQRPELFGACIPMVGVMDMLRFHTFTAGQFWRDEYGSAEDTEQFKALYAYSPYHNIKDGVEYPATLVMTADTDDRVVPMHSFKFAAALQRAQAGDAPILLRIETRAGHGAGTPTSKQIENAADRWAFLVKNLKMDVPVEK